MPMGSTPYLESNPVSVPELTVQEVERVAAPSAVAPFAAAVVLLQPEHRDHRPAVWSDAAVPQARPAAQLGESAARVARALVGVRQGAGVKAFCLPARPGSRRYYYSPQPIP